MKKIFYLFSICFVLCSCEKDNTPRMYLEETVEPAQTTPDNTGDMTMINSESDPHAGFSKEQLAAMLKENGAGGQSNSPVTWTVPTGWEEKAASGMRIATFAAKDDRAAIDCSIVTLGSGAGGLSANIIRWLGQLYITVPPEKELTSFVENLEKISLPGGLTSLVVDFSSFQKDVASESPSMLAAIIDTPQQRIFVKMTGSKANIAKHSASFKSLVQSLEFH